jgi:phosphatidylserine/phosphatidylglycerophosphate/cardiolipin synthase-like enzyme
MFHACRSGLTPPNPSTSTPSPPNVEARIAAAARVALVAIGIAVVGADWGCASAAQETDAFGSADISESCSRNVAPGRSAASASPPCGQASKAGGQMSKGDGAAASSTGPAIIGHFDTPSPSGLQPVIDAVNGARASIRMVMFHLTVVPVVDALAAAARRGVDVQIIIDQTNWESHTSETIKTTLSSSGVRVTPSSPGFRITHVKSFVVDESTAYVMSLNLTSPYVQTRDYAVVTNDKGVVDEFLAVFAADLDNARHGTANTPALRDPHLVWSPVDSEDRLTSFIASATTTLVVSTENLGDAPVQQALIAAAARGVHVRVLAPLCDQNPDVFFNLPFLTKLAGSGIDARAMPSPSSPDTPYIHAKMMIADGERAFVGSINLSRASMTEARELGVLFADPAAVGMMSADFDHDWAKAVSAPDRTEAKCGASAP